MSGPYFNDPPLSAQAACIRRELNMRARVYPRFVQAGKMTQAKADEETRTMEAALRTLEQLQREREPGLF